MEVVSGPELRTSMDAKVFNFGGFGSRCFEVAHNPVGGQIASRSILLESDGHGEYNGSSLMFLPCNLVIFLKL